MSDSRPSRYQVTDRTEPVSKPRRTRRSPVQAIIDSLDGEYYTISQASKMTGVSVNTLRNWYRSPTKNMRAPSKQTTSGEMVIYLYTPEDIQEIQDHKSRSFEERED